MDPISAIAFGIASGILPSGISPATAPMIEAAYSQMLADGLFYAPLLSGLIPINEWRDRELARISNG